MENKLKQIAGSRVVKIILIALGVIIIILSSFRCGMLVGERKASFSYQWGDNYHRMFGGPTEGWMQWSANRPIGGPRFDNGPRPNIEDGFMNPNSVTGAIIKIDTSTIIVKGFDNVEKSVWVNSGTLIRSGKNNISLTDLKTDDKIVVLGVPSSTGQVEAKLIRLFNNK